MSFSLIVLLALAGTSEYIYEVGLMLETAYSYVKELNLSKTSCGKCIFQISCGRMCGERHGSKRRPSSFGISKRLCEVEQSNPCVVSRDAYNHVTKKCQVWPSIYKHDLLTYFPTELQEAIINLKSTECISIERRCFCCCLPYKPDPCTAECVLVPCTDRKSFESAADLPKKRRRRWIELSNELPL